MPTIELVERERVTYVKEMQEYLRQLKQLSKAEAKKQSRKNLIDSNIIQENGEFTERYGYTKSHSKR